MLAPGFYNMDCMDGMREFPDGYFELAIVDPPYGINVGSASMGAGGGVAPHKNRSAKNKRGGVQNNRRFETVREKSKWGGSLHQSQNLQGVR